MSCATSKRNGAAPARRPLLKPLALGLALSLALSLLAAAVPAAASSAGSVEESGMELTTPIRHQLRLLHDAWQEWTRAYYQADREAAARALERLRSISDHLGVRHLPDLSTAAATFAVLSAESDDFERAHWALEGARQLDPERPETDFATATVARLEGNYFGVLTNTVRGYLKLFRLPLERTVWLHNAALWALLALTVAGGLFLALMMVTKGGKLYYDLVRLISPPLPRGGADVVIVAVLVWPIFLPAGLLWLALYWSVLLWGYGSTSERSVFIALWLLLGATPLLLAWQQRSVQLTLSPPVRVLDSLAERRLYGALFSHLGVLRTLLPESSVVTELVADLHRRFGQWEEARSIYNGLAEDRGPAAARAAAPLSNLGLYHLRKKDYGTAVNYFRRATEADPSSAAAFYNLSQAYSQLYEFSQSNQALARAKELDAARVEAWVDVQAPPEESGVGIDGGLARTAEIEQELRTVWRGTERPATVIDLWRQHFSLSIIAATILLAVTLHLVRRQLAYRSDLPAELEPDVEDTNRWVRALVPGLPSAIRGQGGRAYFTLLLPAGLAILPLMRGLGYRAPLGFEAGRWLPLVLCILALALLFGVRLAKELTRNV